MTKEVKWHNRKTGEKIGEEGGDAHREFMLLNLGQGKFLTFLGDHRFELKHVSG